MLHAHDWLVAHAAANLRGAFGVPIVATMHATEAGRHQGWLPDDFSTAIHAIEWWLTYEARRVITCSQHMRWEVTRLFELPPDKVDVLPNGIDLAEWTTDPDEVAAARDGSTPATARWCCSRAGSSGRRACTRSSRRCRACVAGSPGCDWSSWARASQQESLEELARRLRVVAVGASSRAG